MNKLNKLELTTKGFRHFYNLKKNPKVILMNGNLKKTFVRLTQQTGL